MSWGQIILKSFPQRRSLPSPQRCPLFMDGENASQPSRRSPFTWIPAVVVAALLAATGFFVSLRYEPPPVLPAEAPVSIFSAERAFKRLQRLLPDGQPHPLGSPANRRCRAGLLRELEDLGLDPEENDHWVSAGRGSTRWRHCLSNNSGPSSTHSANRSNSKCRRRTRTRQLKQQTINVFFQKTSKINSFVGFFF